MNKTFKVIYSRARLSVTAVSEIARSVHKKGTKTVLAVGIGGLMMSGVAAATNPYLEVKVNDGVVENVSSVLAWTFDKFKEVVQDKTDVRLELTNKGQSGVNALEAKTEDRTIFGMESFTIRQNSESEKAKENDSTLFASGEKKLTIEEVKNLDVETNSNTAIHAFGGTVAIDKAEDVSIHNSYGNAVMSQTNDGKDGHVEIHAKNITLHSDCNNTVYGGSFQPEESGEVSINLNATDRLVITNDTNSAVAIDNKYGNTLGKCNVTITLHGGNEVKIEATGGPKNSYGLVGYRFSADSDSSTSEIVVTSNKLVQIAGTKGSVMLGTQGASQASMSAKIKAPQIVLNGKVWLLSDDETKTKRKLTLNGTTTINGEVEAASGTLAVGGETIFNKDATIGKLEGVNGKDTQLTLGNEKATISVTNENAVEGKDLTLGATGSVNDALGGDVNQLKDKFKEKALKEGATIKMAEGMAVGEVTAKVGENGTLTNVTTKTNSVMSNVLDMATTTPTYLSRMLMNDVRKRLGDVRSTEGTHGAWVRYDGGKLTGSNSLKNNFTTVQMGIDTVPSQDAPRFGAALAYTRSDADMRRGDATMDTYSLALYGTKFFENGLFVDVIGRAALSNADYTVDSDKKGSADNTALSLSGEIGWRYDATPTLFVEPQAEVTYTYTDADTLKLKNATSEQAYSFDKVDSLLGRVGFAAGYTCPEGRGNVYVHASAVHEFLGDATIRSGLNSYKVNGEDTWAEYGIGANYNFSKNAYIYAGLERTDGGKLDEEWRAHLGVRYAF